MGTGFPGVGTPLEGLWVAAGGVGRGVAKTDMEGGVNRGPGVDVR